MIAKPKLPPLPSFAILTSMNEEERHEIEADFILDEAYKNIALRQTIELSESYKELLFAFRLKISQWHFLGRLDIQDINAAAIEWLENHNSTISQELAERLRYSIQIMGIISQYIRTNLLNNSQSETAFPEVSNLPSYQDAISDVSNLPENIKSHLTALLDSSLWLEFIQLGYIGVIVHNKLIDSTRQTELVEILKKNTSIFKRSANLLFRIVQLPKLERDVIEWKTLLAETYGSIVDTSAIPDTNWTFTERIHPA